jgi:DNA polymerase I-like protein with 3'-5' exonuclease and polymerase domains
MRLVFDIESDGLKEDVTQVWCIGIINIDTGEEVLIEPDRLEFGLSVLAEATCLIAHNGINYDLPVLEKLYGFAPGCPVYDTIIMSKMWNADLNGGHSLESWGERFKFPKGEHTDWSQYTTAMGEYCLQDCRVTAKVFDYLQSKVDVNDKPYRLEAAVAKIQAQQEDRGVLFDVKLCQETINEIRGRMARISGEVDGVLGYLPTSPYTATVKPFLKNGKYNNSATSWFGDSVNLVNGEFTRISWEKVTLDTKAMLIKRLLALGWKPTMHTEKGMPQIAVKGDVCPNLLKQGEVFADVGVYFVLKHRLGLLEGLMKVVRKDGTIPSEADTVGAATGRMTHRKIANLPAARSPYGKEIRSCFIPREGNVIVGSDLEGIELRLLAHYMDDKEFTTAIESGDKSIGTDAHTINMKKLGLPNRDMAKTMVYLSMYGGSDTKAGEVVGGGKKEGKILRDKLFLAMPKLKPLTDNLKKQASKGFVTGIDGRKIRVRKDQFTGEYQTHKALNTLIQGSGAAFFKTWVVYTRHLIDKAGLEVYNLMMVHDEQVLETKPESVEQLKTILQQALELTDNLYKVRCKNAIEIKVGGTYYETH